MLARGYQRSFAQRCFDQIKGFSEYGFPESHAASFALLVYVSAWLKIHEPAAFAAALINSQPMGFYAPAQIVRDAQEHGVEVRGVDVGASEWDCTLEEAQGRNGPQPALRLGMRLVKGLKQEDAEAIVRAVKARGHPCDSVMALWRASGVPVATMRRLAGADAFQSMGLDRQAALWQVRGLCDARLPMFDDLPEEPSTRTWAALPPVAPLRKVMHDYASVQLSLKAHPMSFIRADLDGRRVVRAAELRDAKRCPSGKNVAVAGIALVRQRPSTANGIVFMTLEDETGVANLIIRPQVYERCRKAARHGVVLLARGRVERQSGVVHILVHRLEDLDQSFQGLESVSRDFH
jgi:error-prone DNA polymerase